MLAQLRNKTTSLMVKILMVLLLMTFIFWGVGDAIRNHNKGTVLKVGDISYNQMEFSQIFQEQILAIENQLNVKISQNEIKDPKIRDLVVNRIVNNLILLQEAKKMGLLVSDDMVKYEITSMPVFMKDGQFDKEQFQQVLQNSGVTETRFLNLLKEEITLQNLNMFFNTLRYVPDFMVENIAQARLLNRIVTLISIPYSAVGKPGNATEQDLQALYKDNADKFTLPETRDVSYISFGVKDIDAQIMVSDETLKEYYMSSQALFTVPEKRKVNQLVFKEQSQAQEAKDLIKSGKSFDEVGGRYFPDNKSFVFEGITKEGLPEELANVIFNLKVDEVSDVVHSPLGYHVFSLIEVIKESIKPFSEVQSQIKSSYIQEKQFEKLAQMAQDIEQMALSGANLNDIATKYNLSASKVKTLTLTTNHADNKDVSLSKSPSFIQTAFALEKNHLSQVIPYNNNQEYFVIAVDEVYPKVLKEFSVVQNELKTLWENKGIRSKTNELANKIHQSLVEGKTIEGVRKAFNLAAPKTIGLNYYSEQGDSYPAIMLKEIFSLEVGKFSSPVANNNGYVIAYLSKIVPADVDTIKKKAAIIKLELTQELPNDYYTEFVNNLRSKYKVEYNIDNN